MAEKACDGGRVFEAWHNMVECFECGTCVRWDLRDDKFWGFAANCQRSEATEGPVQRGSRSGRTRPDAAP